MPFSLLMTFSELVPTACAKTRLIGLVLRDPECIMCVKQLFKETASRM